MAAPPEKTLKDLSGKWTMNRKLSSDVDVVLQIQGFSSLSRKAIAHAPVYLKVSQDSSQITVDQSTTASIPAIKEQWPFDWQDREHKDKVMGLVKAKARWVTMQDVEGEDTGWLTEGGWLDDWNGEGGKQLEAFVDGIDGKWTAQHVWGFEEHNGSRYFVRRVAVRSKDGSKHTQVKLVYDFDV